MLVCLQRLDNALYYHVYDLHLGSGRRQLLEGSITLEHHMLHSSEKMLISEEVIGFSELQEHALAATNMLGGKHPNRWPDFS